MLWFRYYISNHLHCCKWMPALAVHRKWLPKLLKLIVKRTFLSSPHRFGSDWKLPSIDEFLLMMMRLRLGSLNSDLAERFCISPTITSQIFKMWLVSKVIGSMVYWPDKEQVIATKRSRFRHLPDLVSIIDCSEIFIEKPKKLSLQFSTWSDYKHHNTMKFLIFSNLDPEVGGYIFEVQRWPLFHCSLFSFPSILHLERVGISSSSISSFSLYCASETLCRCSLSGSTCRFSSHAMNALKQKYCLLRL